MRRPGGAIDGGSAFDKFNPAIFRARTDTYHDPQNFVDDHGAAGLPLAAGGRREVTPEAVMTRVQTQYDKAGGFQARFRQESRLKAAGASDSAVGWMYFKKPSRMRWQYETPPEQKKEIVSDGRLVWMYMPADALVMVYKIDQVLRSDLVMRFFSGIGQFQKDFTVSWQRRPGRAPALSSTWCPRRTSRSSNASP